MLRLHHLLGLLISLIAAPAFAQQFDLVCVGTKTNVHVDRGRKTKTTQPLKVRYRLDLERRLYCAAPCTAAEPIRSVAATSIQLYRYSGVGTGSGYLELDRAKGRLTGHEQIYYDPPMGAVTDNFTTEASCTKEPFSGLPKLKF